MMVIFWSTAHHHGEELLSNTAMPSVCCHCRLMWHPGSVKPVCAFQKKQHHCCAPSDVVIVMVVVGSTVGGTCSIAAQKELGGIIGALSSSEDQNCASWCCQPERCCHNGVLSSGRTRHAKGRQDDDKHMQLDWWEKLNVAVDIGADVMGKRQQ